MDKLSPYALAGVVTSLLSEECINRPNVFAAYKPSPEAAAAMQQLMPLASRLEEVQFARSFTPPICLSPLFVGLVESWAAGSDWCVLRGRAAGVAHSFMRRVQETSVRGHLARRGRRGSPVAPRGRVSRPALRRPSCFPIFAVCWEGCEPAGGQAANF